MRYEIIKSLAFIENKLSVVYGLKTDNVCVKDISPSLFTVVKLLRWLKKNDVSEIHLKDVIEDYISSL